MWEQRIKDASCNAASVARPRRPLTLPPGRARRRCHQHWRVQSALLRYLKFLECALEPSNETADSSRVCALPALVPTSLHRCGRSSASPLRFPKATGHVGRTDGVPCALQRWTRSQRSPQSVRTRCRHSAATSTHSAARGGASARHGSPAAGAAASPACRRAIEHTPAWGCYSSRHGKGFVCRRLLRAGGGHVQARGGGEHSKRSL